MASGHVIHGVFTKCVTVDTIYTTECLIPSKLYVSLQTNYILKTNKHTYGDNCTNLHCTFACEKMCKHIVD